MSWQADFEIQALRLAKLERNWDSHGGAPVSEFVLDAARELLMKLMRPDWVCPCVVPAPDGSVQLEWHTGEWDVEIYLDVDSDVYAWGAPTEDRGSEVETEEGDTAAIAALLEHALGAS